MAKAQKNFETTALSSIDWAEFNPENSKYNTYLHIANDYARVEMKTTDFRNETVSWFKRNKPNQAKGLDLVDDWKFFLVGKYYWLLNQGATLTEETMSWLEEKTLPILEEAKGKISHQSTVVPFQTLEPTPEDLGNWLAQDLEDLILTGEIEKDPNSPYNLLKKRSPKPIILRSTINSIQNLIDELNDLSVDEIEEGYKNREAYIKAVEAHHELMNALKTYGQNTKRRRKVNKKRKTTFGKAKKLEKQLENINYKAEDSELKLVSIEPERIVGANSLMVYNTKTRKLGIYYASDNKAGLEVRGTTVHGFDSKKSIHKTLRKPVEQIESFRKATKKRAEIVLRDYVKAKAQPMNGRLNSDTIIMQSWK